MSYYEPISPPARLQSSDDPVVSKDDISAMGKEVEKVTAHRGNTRSKQTEEALALVMGDHEVALVEHPRSEQTEKTLALIILAGECPPVFIKPYADLPMWTREIGLTLLAGFDPMALAGGMSLSQLSQPEGREVLFKQLICSPECDDDPPIEKWEEVQKRMQLPGYPHLKRISRLCRLDGLNGKELVYWKIHRLNSTLLLDLDNAQAHSIALAVFEQFKTASKSISDTWLFDTLKDEDQLPPSEFVRWARKHDFKIPWLEFAKRHYPRLLPEELTRTPIPEDSVQATVRKMDTLDKREETTYLNIIGAMLDLMLGKTPLGNARCLFKNQTEIINAISDNYSNKPGTAKRTLEKKFAAANSKLKEKET